MFANISDILTSLLTINPFFSVMVIFLSLEFQSVLRKVGSSSQFIAFARQRCELTFVIIHYVRLARFATSEMINLKLRLQGNFLKLYSLELSVFESQTKQLREIYTKSHFCNIQL